jgi:hypothetical protein
MSQKQIYTYVLHLFTLQCTVSTYAFICGISISQVKIFFVHGARKSRQSKGGQYSRLEIEKYVI